MTAAHHKPVIFLVAAYQGPARRIDFAARGSARSAEPGTLVERRAFEARTRIRSEVPG